MIAPTLLALLAAVLVAIKGVRKSTHTSRPPLPPGPKPIPFVGSLFSLNRGAPFLTFTAWAKTHGDIVHTRILRRTLIILNTEETARELLDRRSQKYSDRPINSVSDIFGWGWTTITARYGARFRLHRRLLHQVFNAQAATTYRPRQFGKAYEMMAHLLNDPTNYVTHFTNFSAAVVMEVTYGYDTKKGNETFVASMQRAADIILHTSTVTLVALCAMFPFVKALPAWFPGMGFKSDAAECRRLTYEALNNPYAWVKERIEEGVAMPSMVADAITRYNLRDDTKDPELVRAVKETAGSLYAAAVETTNSLLILFVYLMMNHPEIQRRAQAEIDRVVGRQRLPVLEDRESLPYVGAIMREIMRWHPVLPLVRHATSEDDVFRGYYIPKGATVTVNVWAISHNEQKYPNPDVFIPDRFLREDGTLNEDTVSWVFGFGRRICPGRHVADISLWSAMASILALFSIEKVDGSDNVKWSTGMTSHPLPFPCKFIPRDEGLDAAKLSSLIYASRTDF